MRQSTPVRFSTIVVHIRRVAPPASPEISYRPSAIATSGVMNLMDSKVMLRFPAVFREETIVPRTTSSLPLRHSLEETS